MAKILVHLLNFHYITHSHIEIILEDVSRFYPKYFYISRWIKQPQTNWFIDSSDKIYQQRINKANSVLSFEINADPQEICNEWKAYWSNTQHNASCLGSNCAVATQWFLTRFANIPEPSILNLSGNRLVFGIVWPSFIPCPVTLPGRIMSNAMFHIETRDPKVKQYSTLLNSILMATAVLTVAASAVGIYVALNVLSGGLLALATTGCVLTGLVSTSGFFKAYNKLSAKRVATQNNSESVNPLIQHSLNYS